MPVKQGAGVMCPDNSYQMESCGPYDEYVNSDEIYCGECDTALCDGDYPTYKICSRCQTPICEECEEGYEMGETCLKCKKWFCGEFCERKHREKKECHYCKLKEYRKKQKAKKRRRKKK